MSSIYTSDNFVIYTNNNGDPSSEYYAPLNGQETYTIPMAGVIPAGATITAAWYTLLDNIGNSMTGFSHIAVAPAPPNAITLTVRANNGQSFRMRLRVYVQAG